MHTAVGVCHTGYTDCLLAGSGWRNYRPKHVELIGIINKPLLVHLLVVYIIVLAMHVHINIEILLI